MKAKSEGNLLISDVITRERFLMKKWYENLQKWISHLANTKMDVWALFLCAFADASFLPLPITTLFLLLVTLNTGKAKKYIIYTTLGILTGAITAYLAGNLILDVTNEDNNSLGLFSLNRIIGFSDAANENIINLFANWGVWVLIGAVLTPIPYSVFAIFSGVSEINIPAFIFTTLLSHAIKFTLLAYTTIKAGEQLRKLPQHFSLVIFKSVEK